MVQSEAISALNENIATAIKSRPASCVFVLLCVVNTTADKCYQQVVDTTGRTTYEGRTVNACMPWPLTL